MFFSIIETAKENGMHPYRYMEYLLETLPNLTTSALDELFHGAIRARNAALRRQNKARI